MPEARSAAVTGYGAVGRAVVRQLLARGTKVTLVQRSKPAGLPQGLIFKATDLADPQATIEACKGVEAVICATGLPYTVKAFSEDWPVVMTPSADGLCGLWRVLRICRQPVHEWAPDCPFA